MRDDGTVGKLSGGDDLPNSCINATRSSINAQRYGKTCCGVLHGFSARDETPTLCFRIEVYQKNLVLTLYRPSQGGLSLLLSVILLAKFGALGKKTAELFDFLTQLGLLGSPIEWHEPVDCVVGNLSASFQAV